MELEEQTEQLPVTPESAIQSQIFFLMSRRDDIAEKNRPEDSAVLEHISKMITALEQAQQQLAELRCIKQALAVLVAVSPAGAEPGGAAK
jgi:hypothetical protein